MPKSQTGVKAALVTGVFVVVAAVVSAILQPGWWRSDGPKRTSSVIAGTIVDARSNTAIPQASISLSGRSESYVSEDNGNFRIVLGDVGGESERIRLHVAKDGYDPRDISVEPPVENLIIQMQKHSQ